MSQCSWSNKNRWGTLRLRGTENYGTVHDSYINPLRFLFGGCAPIYSLPVQTYVEGRSKNVWALVAGKLQKCSSDVEDFYILVRELMVALKTKELEVWAIVSWSIWNARNKYHFDKKQTQSCDILRGTVTLRQDYQRLCH